MSEMVGIPAHRQRPVRIVRDKNVLGGEPTVAGTRIPVRSIVIGYRRHGGDVGRTAEAYRLDPEAVRVALVFYQAHREEIEALIRENELAAESADR